MQNNIANYDLPILLCPSPWLIYFIMEDLYLWNALDLFCPPFTTPGNHQSVLCIHKAQFCIVWFWFWFLDFTYKWDHMIFSLSAQLLLHLAWWPPSSICVVPNDKISFFSHVNKITLNAESLHHVFFTHSSINGHLGCLSYFGYYK